MLFRVRSHREKAVACLVSGWRWRHWIIEWSVAHICETNSQWNFLLHIRTHPNCRDSSENIKERLNGLSKGWRGAIAVAMETWHDARGPKALKGFVQRWWRVSASSLPEQRKTTLTPHLWRSKRECLNQDHNKLYKQEHGAFNQIKIIIIKAKSSDNINNCAVEMRDWCVCVCVCISHVAVNLTKGLWRSHEHSI